MQRQIQIQGFIKIYTLMNFSSHTYIRKLAGSVIYNLIGDSKELAKYIYDKLNKYLTEQS